MRQEIAPEGREKRHAVGVPFHLIAFARKSIKSRGVYLAFYTFRGRKFPYGNFRTSVFCVVRTQLVGETQFRDSLL